jgi:hypothetical protein
MQEVELLIAGVVVYVLSSSMVATQLFGGLHTQEEYVRDHA